MFLWWPGTASACRPASAPGETPPWPSGTESWPAAALLWLCWCPKCSPTALESLWSWERRGFKTTYTDLELTKCLFVLCCNVIHWNHECQNSLETAFTQMLYCFPGFMVYLCRRVWVFLGLCWLLVEWAVIKAHELSMHWAANFSFRSCSRWYLMDRFNLEHEATVSVFMFRATYLWFDFLISFIDNLR